MRADGRKTSRNEARRHLSKAEEFFAVVLASLGAGQWNGAGLTAIHSGISSGDAALIASAGLRSVAQDHSAVIRLLQANVPEFTATRRRQLAGLLKVKNVVAYEQRLLTEDESKQLVDHARRLLTWASAVVDTHVS